MQFSILIPVVKTKFFKESFESAAAQTFDDYEIVVLNNKADADISWVKENPHVRYFENDVQLPPPANWNCGIGHCLGDFVILLSDDDTLKPETLAELARYRRENPDVEAIRFLREERWEDAKPHRFSCPGSPVETVDEFLYYQETYLRGFALSDYAFSREAALAVGGFRDFPFGWGSDRLLPVEIGTRKNKIGNLGKLLLTYRFTGLSSSAKSSLAEKLQGDCSYFRTINSILETNTGFFKPFALEANKKRLQVQQDSLFIAAFMSYSWRDIRALWKAARDIETSRWRSIFVASVFRVQKWLGKKN
jgi:glycosyltransferase involved in cell wall biosynthesis